MRRIKVSTSLDPQTYDSIGEIAERETRSISNMIERACEELVDRVNAPTVDRKLAQAVPQFGHADTATADFVEKIRKGPAFVNSDMRKADNQETTTYRRRYKGLAR